MVFLIANQKAIIPDNDKTNQQSANNHLSQTMLIQLPAETWIEILDWLRRRDLIKKLEKLWDRQFTPIVQDWLHKYTKNVKLGLLKINNEGLNVRSCACGPNYWCEHWENVPFAGVELPENIISLECITISYMDTNVLAFLRRLRRLFNNNCLKIDYLHGDELPTQTALRLLMPMFSSIESITLDRKLLPFFSANHPSTLSNAKLLQICDCFPLDATNEQILIDWLFTPREDGQPRTLLLYIYIIGFWEKLQERFLNPARQLACPFFIRARNILPNPQMVITNVRTDEQLAVNGILYSVLISNCPINVDPEWLAKKTDEALKWDISRQQQAIWLYALEIEPIDYNVENAEEAI